MLKMQTLTNCFLEMEQGNIVNCSQMRMQQICMMKIYLNLKVNETNELPCWMEFCHGWTPGEDKDRTL